MHMYLHTILVAIAFVKYSSFYVELGYACACLLCAHLRDSPNGFTPPQTAVALRKLACPNANASEPCWTCRQPHVQYPLTNDALSQNDF